MPTAAEIEATFKPILEDGKNVVKGAIKDAIDVSRKFVAGFLKSLGPKISPEEAKQIQDILAEAEDHAVAGRETVALNMVARVNNYLDSLDLAKENQNIKAARAYLNTLLNMVINLGKTAISVVGGPVVQKVADLGVATVEEWLKKL